MLKVEMKYSNRTRAMLAKLPRSIQTRIKQTGLLRAMRPLVKSVKKLLPKRTGALRKSIKLATKTTGDVTTARIYSTHFLLPIFERGTQQRVTRKGAARGRIIGRGAISKTKNAMLASALERARRDIEARVAKRWAARQG